MSSYPYQLTTTSNKDELLQRYKGKPLRDLPTPSIVINKAKFESNCNKMLVNAKKLDANFRAHIKTHKTLEGTLLQLGTVPFKTEKIVVSTMMEAWNILPLVKSGLIIDVHFSLPVVKSRLSELAEFSNVVPHLRIMLDDIEQLDVLANFNKTNPGTNKWSVFIKIDMGTHRAGLIADTERLNQTLAKVLTEDSIKEAVEVYGFYCHAGHSYASTSSNTAKTYLIEEIKNANIAAITAKKIDPKLDLVISVGATPTAHASEILTIEELTEQLGGNELAGKLELHAGNYPCCDLQQISTGCISEDDVSLTLIAEIVSTYPNRGEITPGEQLVNAGVIALAREFGPEMGHGIIVEPKGYGDWVVGRLSQEHGILVPLQTSKQAHKFIPYGTQVKIIPQHCCITAASHPWFYIVDNEDIVIDIWVPFRGW